MLQLLNIFYWAAIMIVILAIIFIVRDLLCQSINTKRLLISLGLYAAIINAGFQLTLMLFVPFLSSEFDDHYYLVFLVIVVPNLVYNVLSLSNKLTNLTMRQ